MKYILVFALAFVVSVVLTPLMINLGKNLKIFGRKADERWKSQPIPRIGGIAIFLGFIITVLIFVSMERDIIIFLLGSVVLFLLGLFDDKVGAIPSGKLLIQLVVVICLMILGIRLKILNIYLAIPLSLIWYIMVINSFNLIDNMDGLSSGITIIASLGFSILAWEKGQNHMVFITLALAGASAGFLIFNFNPAKIFMGDCGSLFIGYVLTTLPMLLFWQESTNVFPDLAAPVLILVYPIFDTIMVTILRLKAGSRPWIGGKDHSSHRLAIWKLGEVGAVFSAYLIGIIGCVSAYIILSVKPSFYIPLLILLGVVALSFGMSISRIDISKYKSIH
ncbi:hypothetical protein GF312_15005 [Candidatus Poribacteria bacterium]|nr:hypothetical protein [Candidatus Poribacteria bacterium]